jgi:hypothetical protein
VDTTKFVSKTDTNAQTMVGDLYLSGGKSLRSSDGANFIEMTSHEVAGYTKIHSSASNILVSPKSHGVVYVGNWDSTSQVVLTGMVQINDGFLKPPVMEIDGNGKTIKMHGSFETDNGPNSLKGSTYFGAKGAQALNQTNADFSILPGQTNSIRIIGHTEAPGFSGASSSGDVVVLTGGNKVVKAKAASSQRYKEQVTPVGDDGADAALALNPVTFVYKSDYLGADDPNSGKHVYGLIAENVQSALGDAAVVFTDEGLVHNYEDRAVVTALLALTQRQQNQIDDLVARVDALEKGK